MPLCLGLLGGVVTILMQGSEADRKSLGIRAGITVLEEVSSKGDCSSSVPDSIPLLAAILLLEEGGVVLRTGCVTFLDRGVSGLCDGVVCVDGITFLGITSAVCNSAGGEFSRSVFVKSSLSENGSTSSVCEALCLDGGVMFLDGGVIFLNGGVIFLDGDVSSLSEIVQVPSGGCVISLGGSLDASVIFLDGGAIFLDGGVIFLDGGVILLDGGVVFLDTGLSCLDRVLSSGIIPSSIEVICDITMLTFGGGVIIVDVSISSVEAAVLPDVGVPSLFVVQDDDETGFEGGRAMLLWFDDEGAVLRDGTVPDLKLRSL